MPRLPWERTLSGRDAFRNINVRFLLRVRARDELHKIIHDEIHLRDSFAVRRAPHIGVRVIHLRAISFRAGKHFLFCIMVVALFDLAWDCISDDIIQWSYVCL